MNPWIGPEQEDLGRAEERLYSIIATAVIKRAFQDLVLRGDIHARCIRRDAYDFLMHRLWEPDSIWREILGASLVKKNIILECQKRYSRRRHTHVSGN